MDTNTEATYTNTGCEGMAVRSTVSMKGNVTAIFPIVRQWTDNAIDTEWAVEFAVQSPTGDGSDYLSFRMDVRSHAQAMSIVKMWRNKWGITAHGTDLDIDGVPLSRPNTEWTDGWVPVV